MYSLIFIYFSLFVAIVSAAVIITGMDEIRIQSYLKVEYKYTQGLFTAAFLCPGWWIGSWRDQMNSKSSVFSKKCSTGSIW